MQDMSKCLDDLLARVAVGSELLYDGLPALSLDGQPLTVAVKAHLAHPAIPAAAELLRGLCTAMGLCLECAECTLCAHVTALREQSLVVQEVMEWSQHFWCAMVAGLPEGCHLPLSLRFQWQHCVHCAHQGLQMTVRATLATESL